MVSPVEPKPGVSFCLLAESSEAENSGLLSLKFSAKEDKPENRGSLRRIDGRKGTGKVH